MAGRAGAVAAGRRRARARPPVHLSQQRQRSEEERCTLAPVTVSAFLEAYGYETRTDSETWQEKALKVINKLK